MAQNWIHSISIDVYIYILSVFGRHRHGRTRNINVTRTGEVSLNLRPPSLLPFRFSSWGHICSWSSHSKHPPPLPPSATPLANGSRFLDNSSM